MKQSKCIFKKTALKSCLFFYPHNILTKDEFITDFLIEMNAKNKAYYFILEKGYFDEFKEYNLKMLCRIVKFLNFDY